MSRPLCVMLVAAEASGDNLGAELAQALRRRLGDQVRFVGVGGVRMAEAGVVSPFPIAELSVLGLLEGLAAYPRVVRRARETAQIADRERPDVAVLIDSWGFTLRVAKRLRRRWPALPLVKYVGPQVWASRPGRARTLAKTVDRLLSINRIDAPYFEAEGLQTIFVGNSSLARDVSDGDPVRLRQAIGALPDDPILLVLPGSRPGEIRRMSPPLRQAITALTAQRTRLHVVIPVASTVADDVRQAFSGMTGKVFFAEDTTRKADAMCAATVALACSGSVTTELALAGRPVVVGYRLSALTHVILKRLVTTPYITLFNIAAGQAVAPELVQSDCTGEALAWEAALRLDDPALAARQVAAQYAALDEMGRGDVGFPAERAADAILDLLHERGRL